MFSNLVKDRENAAAGRRFQIFFGSFIKFILTISASIFRRFKKNRHIFFHLNLSLAHFIEKLTEYWWFQISLKIGTYARTYYNEIAHAQWGNPQQNCIKTFWDKSIRVYRRFCVEIGVVKTVRARFDIEHRRVRSTPPVRSYPQWRYHLIPQNL